MLRGTEISIHAPLTGRDVRQVGLCLLQRLISIHVPPTGHDPPCSRSWPGRCYFNPRAPYGARPGFALITVWNIWISIHVPRTGHDDALFHLSHHRGISIHVPRTGHDLSRCSGSPAALLFQSTCPVQGTTGRQRQRKTGHGDFNPRAPYRARPRRRPVW